MCLLYTDKLAYLISSKVNSDKQIRTTFNLNILRYWPQCPVIEKKLMYLNKELDIKSVSLIDLSWVRRPLC